MAANFEFSILDKLDDSLCAEWDELVDQMHCSSPWQRAGWVKAWRASFTKGTPKIATLRSSNRLVAVMPLEYQLGVLRTPGDSRRSFPWFDVASREEQFAHQLIGAVFKRNPRRLRFEAVPLASDNLELIARCAAETGYSVLTVQAHKSPFIEIDGSWEQFCAKTDKRLLQNIRRRRRRLAELGELSFEIYDGSNDLEALLDEGFRIEASGWKGERGTAIAKEPNLERFYRNIARWSASAGSLRLAFLKVDDKAIAFAYNIEEGNRLFSFKIGHDPVYSKYGPGNLVCYELIERAFKSELRGFEFLGNNDSYKAKWTKSTRDLHTVHAFSHNIVSQGEQFAYSRLRPIARKSRVRVLSSIAHAKKTFGFKGYN
jgi:CelD/BcsL family acetyltransferase involved in cellulose biosynthesis